MKTHYTIALCLLLAATACSSIQEEPVNTERVKSATDEVFYATLEQSGAAEATKVYADENLKVLWNADDRITIYNRYTYGYQYAFQGATGKTAGTFAKVDSDAEFVVGNPLDKIYAVYPHSIDNDINNDGVLSLTWPSPQTYKAESFGIGANVMVSVTENNQLRFRNVGGYLAIKLYGDNVSVSSITLRGNNGEKLSGKAAITGAPDEDPTLTFDASAQSSLRLNCVHPVTIGTTAEDATVFWLVVPPTQFTQGFNITVRTSNGLIFYKSTDIAYEIERNTLCRMAAVEVLPGDIIPFADANFKAYCVENFDTDSDGEISLDEALIVTTIDVCTDNIYSLAGVEFFTNLLSLSASGSAAKYLYSNGLGSSYGDASSLPDPATETSFASGKLTEVDLMGLQKLRQIDISCNNTIESFVPGLSPSLWYLSCGYCNIKEIDVRNNPALTYLSCRSNQLTFLDLSNNMALVWLWCGENQLRSLNVGNKAALVHLDCHYNQLRSLDVSKNTVLSVLECGENQLTTLDVSNNSALTFLNCYGNQLTTLDVGKNTALTTLECRFNQLTTLDVSSNTVLTILMCGRNQLSSLDVSNNTVLIELDCSENLLTILDVSNNTDLTSLYCVSNQLTTLDVSQNTALIELMCGGNQLSSLDVSHNTALTSLSCGANQLTSLDVSQNTALIELMCGDNQLSSLDVSHNTELIGLHCFRNQLTSLDVSNNMSLADLYCYSNPYLTEIWLKTGQTIDYFSYDSTVAQIHYKY